MLKVLGRKNSSNVISVMFTIGELGLEHQRENYGGSFGGLDTLEYRAMNPNAVVPTIIDNGIVLWESNAIVRYLSATYGAGTLWPDQVSTRAIADQWMEWAKTTFYPQFMPVFFGMIRTAEADRDPVKIEQAVTATGLKLEILERRLENNNFVAGASFSMGDIPLAPMLYRYFNLVIDRPSLPNIEAWYQRLSQRPAFQQHGMIPFGNSLAEWMRLEQAGTIE